MQLNSPEVTQRCSKSNIVDEFCDVNESLLLSNMLLKASLLHYIRREACFDLLRFLSHHATSDRMVAHIIQHFAQLVLRNKDVALSGAQSTTSLLSGKPHLS